jgi:hypothetical protein
VEIEAAAAPDTGRRSDAMTLVDVLTSETANLGDASRRDTSTEGEVMPTCKTDRPRESIVSDGLPSAPNAGEFISNYDLTCLYVKDFPSNIVMRWEECADQSLPETFESDPGTGRILFPSSSFQSSEGKNYYKNTFCLALSGLAQARAGQLSFALCDPADPTQRWSRKGQNIVSDATQECVTRTDGSDETQAVVMRPCDFCDQLQSWTVGSVGTLQKKRIEKLKGTSIDVACRAPLVRIIDRDNNSPSVRRILRMFGGTEGLSSYMARTYVDVCRIFYDQAEQVPFRSELHVVMWPTTFGSMNTTFLGGEASINVNDTQIALDTRPDQVLHDGLLQVWHHEMGHALQYMTGLDSGLIEGVANWIVWQYGILSATEKTHGGSWHDGYSRTSFFLDWLDKTYPSKTDPRKFTNRLNLKAMDMYLKNMQWSPGAWFLEETGSSIDDLWTKYQASF